MKKLIYPALLLLLALGLASCSDKSSPTGPDTGSPPEEASSAKQFVWNAMNRWYLYQADVADLADDRFAGDEAFQQYLMGYADAEALFNDLQTEDDPYSFFIDDYEEYEQRQDGIYAALGFNYGYILLNDNETIVGYVQYIVPGSPADDAGLNRGDLFTKVDGTSLNINNYRGLLSSNSSHTLTLAKIEDNTIVETGETVTVESERVEENPIFLSSVIDTSNTQIGYLMYNAFRANSHESLNQVFGNFESQGVDELVLDLRYNGGGAVITSQVLASMISGLDNSNVFASFTYNQKQAQYNNKDYFLEAVPLQNEEGEFEQNSEGEFVNTIPLNTLGLNRVYILTSTGTASASEALINSLKPFIEVVLIGNTTEGKDVGSITLYDAEPNYTNKENINPNHKKAIQPIVVAIRNANDQRYPNGFEPDDKIREIDYLENLPPLGSPEDPLFGQAIARITGQAAKMMIAPNRLMRDASLLKSSLDMRPHGKEMYIEPFMLPAPDGK